MTKDEALKMAIEALESIKLLCNDNRWYLIGNARKACKEALLVPTDTEQPAQEPVAWLLEYRYDEFDYWHKNCDEDKLALEMWFDAIRYDTTEHKIYPLYTHPAPSWQGLTDDEMQKIISEIMDAMYPWKEGMLGNLIARAIEQALKEKNT